MEKEQEAIMHCHRNPEWPDRNFVEVKVWNGIVYCTEDYCPEEYRCKMKVIK